MIDTLSRACAPGPLPPELIPPFAVPLEGRSILGIDPGVTGGIAFYIPQMLLCVYDLPVAGGELDVPSLARTIRSYAPRAAVIERAGAMPKQGVSSTFKYAAAYGALKAICAVLEIPTHLVTPGKWKNHFRLTSDKETSRALAIRYWPACSDFSRKKDHGRAEAALIARYGVEMIPGLRGAGD